MGVYRILVHSMVDAIEQASVRKGFDPREFVLVAEGGGGPLFAPEIAPEVGVKNVLVPSYPGITAALGLLTTDMVYEYVATSYAMASALYTDSDALHGARGAVREAPGRGARAVRARTASIAATVRLENIAEARYEGQGYELRIDVGTGTIDDGLDRRDEGRVPRHPRARVLAPLRGRRRADRERPRARRRHHARPRRAAGRAAATRRRRRARSSSRPTPGSATAASSRRSRRAFYERTELLAGNVIEGPAIITQFDSTSVVPPGFTCTVDGVGNLVITYSEAVQQAAERGH